MPMREIPVRPPSRTAAVVLAAVFALTVGSAAGSAAAQAQPSALAPPPARPLPSTSPAPPTPSAPPAPAPSTTSSPGADAASRPAPLPALDVVIDAALSRAPERAVQEAVITRSRQELSRSKKQWMEGITIGADASYGSYGSSIVDAVRVGQGVELGIKVSLFDILAREAQTGVYAARLEAARRQHEVVTSTLRKKVIDAYYDARRTRRLTEVQSDAYAAAELRRRNVTVGFQQGTASVQEISRVSEVAAKARARLVSAQTQYERAYRQLERLAGISLRRLQTADSTRTLAPPSSAPASSPGPAESATPRPEESR